MWIRDRVSIERELENMISYYAGEKKIKQLRLLVSPYVAAYLKSGFPSVRRRWMSKYGFRLKIGIDQSLGIVEYKFLDRKDRVLSVSYTHLEVLGFDVVVAVQERVDAPPLVVEMCIRDSYNTDQAAEEEQPTGGCGFFECIDSQEVADMLFDAAREWLRSKGMEAMDGPINFGNRDEWWGCLVQGFELQPLYTNPYNPPYYKELFEHYGFQNYFNQYTYQRNIRVGEFNQSVYDRVKRLEETPGYRFDHIDKRNLEQVADDFRLIYNKAWANFPGVRPMTREAAQALMRNMKPIIDEKLIYFAYFNDEPVRFV